MLICSLLVPELQRLRAAWLNYANRTDRTKNAHKVEGGTALFNSSREFHIENKELREIFNYQSSYLCVTLFQLS